MSSRSRPSGVSASSSISDEQVHELASKLQQLLPELRRRNSRSDKVSAGKVLKETCKYIQSLQREVDDLSERLSQLLLTSDNAEAAAIIRTLLTK